MTQQQETKQISTNLPKARYLVGEPRTEQIQLKITTEGRDFIYQMAVMNGKSMVGYLRHLVEQDAKRNGIEAPTI